MKKQELIKDLYFNKKNTQKEIAEMLDVSTQYVSKILLQDNSYKQEKERRKLESKIKHTQNTIKHINNKRKLKNVNMDYDTLKKLHIDASRELSGRSVISNKAFRNWNTSAYKYNYKTKSYILKKDIITGFDVPKRVNWKSY